MAFTGQILRFDQDAYWGLGIGASIAGRVPVVGPQLVQVILGGPIIAGETLTRFFALHVFVIPGAPDRLRRPAPADGAQARRQRVADARAARPARDLPEGVRTARPQGRRAVRARWRFTKDLVFAGLIVLAVIACAAYLRALRAERRARPDDHRDRAAAGLLLPLDLRGRWRSCPRTWRRRPCSSDPSSASALLLALPCSRRGGREELAPAAGGRAHDRASWPCRLRHAHAARHDRALVPGDGRLERGCRCPSSSSQGRTRAASGRARLVFQAQAVPQLPCARRSKAAGAAPRSTTSRCG